MIRFTINTTNIQNAFNYQVKVNYFQNYQISFTKKLRTTNWELRL